MTDIVQRLRDACEGTNYNWQIELHNEAADEIEALRKELAEVNTDRDRWIRRADKTWHEEHIIRAERERCAKIVRDHNPGGSYHIRTELEAAIREQTP
jgi:hypothetical protein